MVIIGQSHDFWWAYSLFVGRVASFAASGARVRMLLRGFGTNSDTSARQNLTIVLTPEFEKVSVLKIIYV